MNLANAGSAGGPAASLRPHCADVPESFHARTAVIVFSCSGATDRDIGQAITWMREGPDPDNALITPGKVYRALGKTPGVRRVHPGVRGAHALRRADDGADRAARAAPAGRVTFVEGGSVCLPPPPGVPRPAAGQPDVDAAAQPDRACRGRGGRHPETGLAAHAPAQLRHASARAGHRHPGDPGAARPCEARHHRALRPGGHLDDPHRHEPARPADLLGERARPKA